MVRLIAFGYHDRESPRHRSVCAALTKDGGIVIECHTDAPGLLGKYFDLWKKFRALTGPEPGPGPGPEIVLVPFPGHFLMPLAWWLTRRPRRRLIFDAFLSLYDTDVSDRRRYSRWNPWAWCLWMIDWLSMHLADEVLIDTQAHRQFLIDTFHVKPERVRVIYLEAITDLFYLEHHPTIQPSNHPFNIFFSGTLIPLQGVDVILGAALALQLRNDPVHFTLVGSRKFAAMAEKLGLHNVTTDAFVPMERLPDMMRCSDLCLGIFGTSGKAQRVIPHKVVDAVACGIPVITADTPAIRERFANHPLVHLVPAGNSAALTAEIVKLVSATKK